MNIFQCLFENIDFITLSAAWRVFSRFGWVHPMLPTHLTGLILECSVVHRSESSKLPYLLSIVSKIGTHFVQSITHT